MLKNYFKTAFRNLTKNKGFSFINIFGFALGIFVCIIIMIYVYDDMTFDHHIDEPENVYRVISNDNSKIHINMNRLLALATLFDIINVKG